MLRSYICKQHKSNPGRHVIDEQMKKSYISDMCYFYYLACYWFKFSMRHNLCNFSFWSVVTSYVESYSSVLVHIGWKHWLYCMLKQKSFNMWHDKSWKLKLCIEHMQWKHKAKDRHTILCSSYFSFNELRTLFDTLSSTSSKPLRIISSCCNVSICNSRNFASTATLILTFDKSSTSLSKASVFNPASFNIWSCS